MNDIFEITLTGNLHLLIIWIVGLGWAIGYRQSRRRIFGLTAIALLALIATQFALQPSLTWLLMRKQYPLANSLSWLNRVIEGSAWVILLGTLFDRREQEVNAAFRPSEHTRKCPKCGCRNSKRAEVCATCGLQLLETEGQAGLSDFVRHYFDWNHDLGISTARRRGVYRALAGASLMTLGGLIWFAAQHPLAGAPVAIGVASLPCAAAEMLTNREWNQINPIVRIGLLSVTPFVFAATVWLATVTRLTVG